MFPRINCYFIFATLAVLAAFRPQARAQHEGEAKLGTAITSLPYTISSPGVYVLKQDFLSLNATTPAAAIQINASDVVLDFNGHTIRTTGTLAYGVYSTDQSNVTVRNGTIQGFSVGVALTETNPSSPTATSYGHTVEKLNVNGCGNQGISLDANDSIVRSCQVSNIGASGQSNTPASAFGIALSGSGLRCLDCSVSGATSNVSSENSFAIYLVASANAFVAGNKLSGFGYGIYFAVLQPGNTGTTWQPGC